MKIISFLLLFILSMTLSEERQKKEIYNEHDIFTDSEIGYILIPSGFSLSRSPNKFKRFVVCERGKVHKIFGDIWHDGRFKEIHREASLRKYLNLWRALQKFGIWNMESKDPGAALPEESEKLLDMYEELRLDQSTYEFLFRIKNKKHKFTVYDITKLRDKNYLAMLKEINKFFGIKEILE